MIDSINDSLTNQLRKCNTIFTPILILGLAFTITNRSIVAKAPYLIISALPSGLILLSLPFLYLTWLIHTYQRTHFSLHESLFKASKQWRISTAVLLYYIFSLLSTLWYHSPSLIEYHYYRYDANFIVSYAAFLFLPFFRHKLNLELLFSWFVIGAAGLTLILLALYFDSGIIGLSQHDQFRPLFQSTNGAGGFYSIICCLALARISQHKTWLSFVCFIVLFVALLLTESRGSMLGFLAAVCIYTIIQKPKTRWLVFLGIAIIIIFQAILIQKYYPVYQTGVSGGTYHQQMNQKKPNVKIRNIQRRLIDSWPKAVDLFMQAPLLGNGFGSYNDFNKKQAIQPKTTQLNKKYSFNDLHAHHSYLHILAEQGLLGLFLIGLFWGRLLYELLRPSQPPNWLRLSLTLCTLTIIMASFTEHRLTTPAMLLPFSYLMLLYFGDRTSLGYCDQSK